MKSNLYWEYYWKGSDACQDGVNVDDPAQVPTFENEETKQGWLDGYYDLLAEKCCE
jgi:hypothetical protein